MLSGDAAISQESVFAVIKALFFGELREFGVLAAELICICIIAGLLSSFTSGFGSGTASGMSSVICSFAAAGICMTAFYQLYQLGIQSVSLMTTLMGASLPVIFAVTAVSGGAASATVLSSVISAAVTAFSAFVRYVLMPVVFVSGIFTVANSVGRRSYIGKTAAFLRSAALFGMGAAITLFTGLSVIQGMMTKSADDLLMKTARYSIDNLIPFVGGFAADSLEMIVTCIRSIRGGIGMRRRDSSDSAAGRSADQVGLHYSHFPRYISGAGTGGQRFHVGLYGRSGFRGLRSDSTAVSFERYVHYFFHLCSALRTFSVEGEPPDFRCRAHSDVTDTGRIGREEARIDGICQRMGTFRPRSRRDGRFFRRYFSGRQHEPVSEIYFFSDSSRRHFISCDTAAAVTVSGGKKTGNSVMIRRKAEYR